MLVDFLQIHGSRCGSALIGTSTVISLVISRKYLRNRSEWIMERRVERILSPVVGHTPCTREGKFLNAPHYQAHITGNQTTSLIWVVPDWEDLVDSSTYHGRTWWFSFFATYPATETAAFAASASENRCVVRYSISLLHLANRPMSM